jgi:hypothetical protein
MGVEAARCSAARSPVTKLPSIVRRRGFVTGTNPKRHSTANALLLLARSELGLRRLLRRDQLLFFQTDGVGFGLLLRRLFLNRLRGSIAHGM